MPLLESLSFEEKRRNNDYQKKCLQLQKNLRKRVRILLTDGRVVEGKLQCFDSSLTMIFVNAVEVNSENECTQPIGRMILSECLIKQFQPCACA